MDDISVTQPVSADIIDAKKTRSARRRSAGIAKGKQDKQSKPSFQCSGVTSYLPQVSTNYENLDFDELNLFDQLTNFGTIRVSGDLVVSGSLTNFGVVLTTGEIIVDGQLANSGVIQCSQLRGNVMNTGQITKL